MSATSVTTKWATPPLRPQQAGPPFRCLAHRLARHPSLGLQQIPSTMCGFWPLTPWARRRCLTVAVRCCKARPRPRHRRAIAWRPYQPPVRHRCSCPMWRQVPRRPRVDSLTMSFSGSIKAHRPMSRTTRRPWAYLCSPISPRQSLVVWRPWQRHRRVAPWCRCPRASSQRG